jgi:hypothetical protein
MPFVHLQLAHAAGSRGGLRPRRARFSQLVPEGGLVRLNTAFNVQLCDLQRC